MRCCSSIFLPQGRGCIPGCRTWQRTRWRSCGASRWAARRRTPEVESKVVRSVFNREVERRQAMKKGRRGNLKSGTSKGRRQGNQRWWPQPQTLPETLSHIRAFHGIRTFRDDGPGGPSWRPSRESSCLPTQTPERQRRKEWGGGEKSTKDQGTTAQPMSKGATPPTNASNPTRTTLPNTRCRRLTDRKLRVAQVPAKKVKVPPIVRPTSRSQRGGNKAHTGVRSHNQQHLMPNNKKKN